MKNRVCELLGIKYPIIEGGMAHIGNGLLAAAVSEGGGFGQIGCAGRTPENLEEEILIAFQKTNKPFGVNLPLSEYKDPQPYIDVIEKHKDKIKAISLSAGNPKPYIPIFKEMGLVVMVIIATQRHAINAQSQGADIIVCEGYEAGGHNGAEELTTFALIPQIAKIAEVPLVAAGGITNGAGVAAAMMLGAEGVQLGTRFIATTECEAHENYKKKILESQDIATTVLTRKNGVIRVLKSEFVAKVQEKDNQAETIEEILPYIRGTVNRKAAIGGDFENGWASAGQGSGLIQEIESAELVVKKIVAEANERFSQFNNFQL